jgi:hypothetical protein
LMMVLNWEWVDYLWRVWVGAWSKVFEGWCCWWGGPLAKCLTFCKIFHWICRPTKTRKHNKLSIPLHLARYGTYFYTKHVFIHELHMAVIFHMFIKTHIRLWTVCFSDPYGYQRAICSRWWIHRVKSTLAG